MSGSLLRAEARRFASRRFIRVVLLLGVLSFCGGTAIASTQFSEPGGDTLASAQSERDSVFAAEQQRYQQCLTTDPGARPPGVDVMELCGGEPRVEDFGRVEDFVDEQPFTLDGDGLAGAQGIGFVTAAVLFFVGATFIGAEWSSRSVVALLFWEPRRVRVMGAKVAVLVAASLAIAALVQVAWLGAARVLASTRGITQVPDGFYGDLASTSGRAVLFAVFTALLGFGIANAVRNTAASLGFGFVYFAVAESIVRALKPAWAQWLITDNAVAFLQRERYTIYVDDRFVDDRGMIRSGREIVLTHAEAGLYLLAVCGVVVAIGIVLFQRRDLT